MPVGLAVKVIIVIIISSVLFRRVSSTANHSVGGPTGWDLASDLGAWAAANTFYAGDNLVFSYGPTHDVLEVNGADFARCRTTNPIKAYNDDGETVVLLQESGITRYFFCGRRRHCDMGLKLEVEVLIPLVPSSSPNANGTSSSSNKNPPTSSQDGHPHRGAAHPSPPPDSRSSHPNHPYPDDLPPPPRAAAGVVVDNSHDHHECCPSGGGGGAVSDPTKLGIVAIWLHVVALAMAVIIVFF